MIECKRRFSGYTSATWYSLKNTKYEKLNFGMYVYRIDGVEYYHNTEEFKKHYNDALVWDMLND